MKRNKLKFAVSLSFVLLLASILSLFSQQQRYQGEIMVTVCGMTGQDKKWTVTATALSSIRWNIINGQCYITSGYSSASVSGEGNDGMPNGFRCPCQHVAHGQDLAFSKYEFSWDLPAPHSDPDSIILDLRDADWACNYSESDITIRYNIDSSRYEVRIGGQGNPFNKLTENRIWDILDEAPPNQEAFQPTPPRNFRCTNPTQIKAHPHFNWRNPEWPPVQKGKDDLTVCYRIFRNDNLIANNITSKSFTDEDVYLYPGAPIYTYYVKAYLSQSPDSDPSNTVTINNDWKSNSDNEKYVIKETDKSNFPISCYPNPFNPEIKITYTLQLEARINLSIYNIAGQKIATLINEPQSAGSHTDIFNGESLPAGVYLVNLQAGRENYLRKVLLVK